MSNNIRKILLVEDEQDLLESYAEIIETEVENTQVIKASDGYKALDLLRDKNNHFDLIILDLMMPGIDGLEVLRVIRDNPEIYGEKQNVTILTAMVSDNVINECYELGAKGYLIKAELSMGDVPAEIERALERASEE